MSKRLSWAVRLERAEKRGRFTDKDVELAFWSFITCAIGERHNWKLQRKDDWDWDITEQEFKLGGDFGYAVNEQDIPDAKRIYQEIMALP